MFARLSQALVCHGVVAVSKQELFLDELNKMLAATKTSRMTGQCPGASLAQHTAKLNFVYSKP